MQGKINLCKKGSVMLAMWLAFTAGQQTLGAAAEATGGWSSGAQLYQRLACHGCHSRQGQGGTVGPTLDGLDERLSRQEVAIQLLAPRRRQADSRMPSFAFLRPGEQQDLMVFVYGKGD